MAAAAAAPPSHADAAAAVAAAEAAEEEEEEEEAEADACRFAARISSSSRPSTASPTWQQQPQHNKQAEK